MQEYRKANLDKKRFISREERDVAKEALKKEDALGQILGNSQAIREIHKKIRQVSFCDVNVLLSGESGTGKELVARAIHYLSHRAGKPFVPVNCGAIPENLFESELFGHEKGAFTGAYIKQNGLVKEAEGGTLFLDEISTITPYTQVKLLRLLQDSEYKPLGNSRNYKANIRIIAATNCPLIELVKKGSFREDLYYRLNIVSLHLPPLRERKKDIPILIEHFLNKYTKEYKKPDIKISHEDLNSFKTYPWQGNIRELENMIQRFVVMSTSGKLTIKNTLPSAAQPESDEIELENFKTAKKKIVKSFEKTYLTNILREYNGNVARAAKHAGKSRTAFWNLIKKHNISPKLFQ